MAITQPLDLFEILVNQFVGNTALFAILALIIIAIAGAYFRMPNLVLGGMIVVFAGLFMGTAIGEGTIIAGIFILAVVLVGAGFAFDSLRRAR